MQTYCVNIAPSQALEIVSRTHLTQRKSAFDPLQTRALSLTYTGMLRRVFAKYQTVRALLAWNDNDWAGCLAYLTKAEKQHPLRVFEAAFRAQALIALREQAEADQLLADTIARIDEAKSANERYIQIWCMLWRQDHFRDLPNSNALWAEAGSLDCSNYLRRFLLLRRPPELALYR